MAIKQAEDLLIFLGIYQFPNLRFDLSRRWNWNQTEGSVQGERNTSKDGNGSAKDRHHLERSRETHQDGLGIVSQSPIWESIQFLSDWVASRLSLEEYRRDNQEEREREGAGCRRLFGVIQKSVTFHREAAYPTSFATPRRFFVERFLLRDKTGIFPATTKLFQIDAHHASGILRRFYVMRKEWSCIIRSVRTTSLFWFLNELINQSINSLTRSLSSFHSMEIQYYEYSQHRCLRCGCRCSSSYLRWFSGAMIQSKVIVLRRSMSLVIVHRQRHPLLCPIWLSLICGNAGQVQHLILLESIEIGLSLCIVLWLLSFLHLHWSHVINVIARNRLFAFRNKLISPILRLGHF